ncbi:MAG: 4Fe-4S dicluster domain-containing protein [Lachnospiraceae bacterium]|nr:4Fe-4S dicluster domain-containing protein [Lachnospiraceae bacterium]
MNNDEKFTNSVRLDPDLCKGCINCIKRCPTQAIRVRNHKAIITKERCIDCGECIRICQNHAKLPSYDSLDVINNYEYTVALPAPSLYGQFNNLDDVNIVLTALKRMGFDDVYEVGASAEVVSQLSRDYIKNHREQWPLISTACPSVVRLIRVKFPNLIEHLLPIDPPVEIAAKEARKRAVEKSGLPEDKIGIVFISPCPSKVTSVKAPLGMEKSNIDAVCAIKDVYVRLLPIMKRIDEPEDLAMAGKIGVGWGVSGGEAGGLITDNYLAADGIENVNKILEDLEDQKFGNLEFIELNACNGGCVGGVLTVENPYVAKVKMNRLKKYMPVALKRIESGDAIKPENAMWTKEIEYEPVFALGEGMKDNIHKMNMAEEIEKRLPGLDCGACGAPTCRALAEDIVKGEAKELDCIHLLREYVHKLSGEMSKIDG